MTEQPVGIPGWIWLVGVFLTVGVPAFTTWLVSRPSRRNSAAAHAAANQAVNAANAAATAANKAATASTTAASAATHAATELSPNHGGSAKDGIEALRAQVGELTTTMTVVAADVAAVKATGVRQVREMSGLRREMRTERDDRIKDVTLLSGRLEDHIRSAAAAAAVSPPPGA